MLPVNTPLPTDRFRVFLVCYHIAVFRQKPYMALLATLRSTRAWLNLMGNLWLLGTHESPASLKSRLRSHLDASDQLLMIEIPRGTKYQGLLSNNAWAWLRRFVGLPGQTKIEKSMHQLAAVFAWPRSRREARKSDELVTKT